MVRTDSRIRESLSGRDGRGQEHQEPPADPESRRGPHRARFRRHFLEMLAVMTVGMVGAGAVFAIALRIESWDEATVRYPTQSLLVMAAGMTVPMVTWMLFRGMGRRNSLEMAAAMLLPAIPFLCLVWFHVTESAQCGAYCASTVVAMLGLMVFRRTEYAT
jgi:hypothetical protein